MLAMAIVVIGLGLASSAWLQLVRVSGDRRLEEGDRLALVRRASACWVVPLLLAPPMFSRDGWSYGAQGVMTHLGLSPYVWAPNILDGEIVEAVDPMWRSTLTPYGPVPLIWGSAAAGVTVDPWLLAVAHRLLSLVGLVLLAWAVPRLARWSGVDAARSSALVLASPLMVAHGVAGLHNDVLMVAVGAVALVVAVEHGWVPGAVLVGVAAAVKLPAGLFGIGVVLLSLPLVATHAQRTWRTAAVALVAVGTLAGIGAVSGLGVGWVHALGVPGEVLTPMSVSTQLGRLVELMTGLDAVATVRGLGSALLLAIAVGVALRARTGCPRAAVRATAGVALAAVVLSPVVHHWYLLWCLPLLAVCHLPRRGERVLLHVSWLGGLVAPLDSSLAGADGIIALAVALVAGTALVQSLAHRRHEAQAEVRVEPSRAPQAAR
ncbi:hypothetical protein ASG94_17185 [Nocardioides sp. Soil805]|nr:hypothetical protein ASG94_17185 [Nocardioides sp. Soil805]